MYLFLTIHSNFAIKSVIWPHFSWTTLEITILSQSKSAVLIVLCHDSSSL